MQMPLHPTWPDIALRLLLTLVGAGVIGWNRGMRGHAAGLRTTVLVGLAAALAMIQCNLLLDLRGHVGDSFATMDLMRLPLGILTGVGFIGGGAILKRGELVVGLTTAATLWVVTVLGLCFGGGQIALGSIGTVLAGVVLWAMRELEERLPRDHRALLSVSARGGDGSDIEAALRARGFTVRAVARRSRSEGASSYSARYEIAWRSPESYDPSGDLDKALSRIEGLLEHEAVFTLRH